MTAARLILILLCLSGFAAQAAGLYRWVDSQGHVTYSDQPPPPSVKRSEQVRVHPNVVDTDKESFALRRASELSPVQLYTTDCGLPCQQAKDFLDQRGIPYTVKDPKTSPEVAQALKNLVGSLEVPVITVGSNHYKGFLAGAWGQLLDDAGYPRENPLNQKPGSASPSDTGPESTPNPQAQ